MEEDMKLLKDETNALGLFLKCKGTGKYAQAIENLIKRVKQLEAENNSWKKYCTEDLENQIADLSNKNFELEAEKKQVLDDYQDLGKDLAYNFIPKSKIREKLEEYDKQRIKMEKYDNGVGFTLDNEWSDLKAKIQVLQELMEDK